MPSEILLEILPVPERFLRLCQIQVFPFQHNLPFNSPLVCERNYFQRMDILGRRMNLSTSRADAQARGETNIC